jgi:hypothetical protein
MLDPQVVAKLKVRYSHLHPLLFHRSVERAKSNGDLFDILDTAPKTFPIKWCDRESRWVEVDDLYIVSEFDQLQ